MVLFLAALGVDCPLGEQVNAVTDADGAAGKDYDECFVFGVVVPVEFSLVDEHLDCFMEISEEEDGLLTCLPRTQTVVL